MDRSAIVLVVDQLSASMLGPYGNTWYESQAFNRLAAQSLLLENSISDCPDLKTAYRSLWYDVHALCPRTPAQTFAEGLADHGIELVLLTDYPADQLAVGGAGFERIIEINPRVSQKGLASDKNETQLARFFAQAIELITRQRDPCFFWLHSRGLHGNWDAPYDMRERLADDEDPDPPDFYAAPHCHIDPSTPDPDQLLGFQLAAGAQISLIDEFLGVLLDELDGSWIADSAMFCLMSPRGFPLGEHHLVGDLAWTLHAEALDVPLMIRWPDRRHQCVRSQSLVYPRVVNKVVADWLNNGEGSDRGPDENRLPLFKVWPDKARDLICSVAGDSQALQTHAWKLIKVGQQHRLYVKPDDRWEVNDVSDRCPQIAERLDLLLDSVVARLSSDANEIEFQLDETLAYGID